MKKEQLDKLLSMATITEADVKMAIKKASDEIRPFMKTITINKFNV